MCKKKLLQELHWQMRTNENKCSLRILRGYRHSEHHYWGNVCLRSIATKLKVVHYELSCSDVVVNLLDCQICLTNIISDNWKTVVSTLEIIIPVS